MSRINRPPGDNPGVWYKRTKDEPVAVQPNPPVNVTDPEPVKVLFGPRGEVIARLDRRNPIGYR